MDSLFLFEFYVLYHEFITLESQDCRDVYKRQIYIYIYIYIKDPFSLKNFRM